MNLDLELLDAELVGGDTGQFVVDSKVRADNEKGVGFYLLHATGDASRFRPGSTLFTPDGIIWDVVSVDPDKAGLTVSKKREDVSFTAWLTGDWSSLSGQVPPPDPDDAWKREAAMSAREVAHNLAEGAGNLAKDAGWLAKHWKAALAVGAVIGVGAVAAPVVMPLLAARKVLP